MSPGKDGCGDWQGEGKAKVPVGLTWMPKLTMQDEAGQRPVTVEHRKWHCTKKKQKGRNSIQNWVAVH
jgi:hypothetical protein